MEKKINKKAQLSLIITIAVLVVLGLIIFYLVYNNKTISSSNTDSTSNVNEEKGSVISAGVKTNTIEITSSGFSPSKLEINKGDKVTWVNKDTSEHWPASAMHPTHTVYPGVNYEEGGSYAGSKGCISEGQAKEGSFDTCRGLAAKESWSFTFNQVGSWNYHDHLVSGKYGSIVVK